jgi:23S rRNA (cytidine1920-2'-O)/16S rRNA (cytidine1409-2'-O)-methyltransferase
VTERLDRELVRRGLARSRSHAQALINAGQILVDGSVVERPGEQVAASAAIHGPDDRYVSRAAHKLIGALDDLQLSVTGASPRRGRLDRRLHPGPVGTRLPGGVRRGRW